MAEIYSNDYLQIVWEPNTDEDSALDVEEGARDSPEYVLYGSDPTSSNSSNRRWQKLHELRATLTVIILF